MQTASGRRFMRQALLWILVLSVVLSGAYVLTVPAMAVTPDGAPAPRNGASDHPDDSLRWESLTMWQDMLPLYEPAVYPANLDGKTVVLRWNGKHNGDVLLDHLATRLEAAFPEARIVKAYRLDPSLSSTSGSIAESRRITQAIMDMKPDLVITAPGDCRACAAWLSIDQVALERNGVPTLSLVTNPFFKTFHNVRRNLRMDTMCCLVIPHPVAVIPVKKIQDKVDALFPEIEETLRHGCN